MAEGDLNAIYRELGTVTTRLDGQDRSLERIERDAGETRKQVNEIGKEIALAHERARVRARMVVVSAGVLAGLFANLPKWIEAVMKMLGGP